MNTPTKKPSKVAIQMVSIQAAVLAVFFIIVWIFLGGHKAYALGLGGLCAWVPAFIYALIVFAKMSTKKTNRFVAIFYMGSFIKLFLSAGLVAIAVVVFKFDATYVLLGFIITLVAFMIGTGLVKQ